MIPELKLLKRYKSFLISISKNYIQSMIDSEKITHLNFFHWIDHIEKIILRKFLALQVIINNPFDSTELKCEKCRKLIGSFVEECNLIFDWAEKNDKNLKE